MREVLTKSMARNIFYGGSLFFILIFIGLSVHSHWYIVNVSTNEAPLMRALRGAGFVAGDAMPWLQGWLVGGAMGYRGDVPALCRTREVRP